MKPGRHGRTLVCKCAHTKSDHTGKVVNHKKTFMGCEWNGCKCERFTLDEELEEKWHSKV